MKIVTKSSKNPFKDNKNLKIDYINNNKDKERMRISNLLLKFDINDE